MTIDEMVAVIAVELNRQAEADTAFAPYVDVSDAYEAIIDGRISMRELAAAIIKAGEKPPPSS